MDSTKQPSCLLFLFVSFDGVQFAVTECGADCLGGIPAGSFVRGFADFLSDVPFQCKKDSFLSDVVFTTYQGSFHDMVGKSCSCQFHKFFCDSFQVVIMGFALVWVRIE
jgi:hypothetical protein